MGKPEYLIDSNVVTDYLAGLLPSTGMEFMHPVIDAVPRISVITRIEILGFNTTEYGLIADFVEHSIVYDLTEPIIQETIALRKSRKIKLPDAVIAATALVHGLKLITQNEADFLGVKGLSVLNPHKR